MYLLYFDPGLGAMIAQAVVAAAAAIALFSKNVKYKIKSILGLHKEQEDDLFETIEDEADNDKK